MSHSALADMMGPAFRGGRCRVQIGRTSWSSWPRRRSWGGWAVFLLGMGQGTAVCPICCNVVPIPIINDHIDSGCTMMTKPAPSWGSLASPSSSANATPNRKRRRRSHFVECPVCQKSVAEINLDDHLDKSCLAKSSYPPPATVPMSQSNRVDPTNTPGRSINDVLSPKPATAFNRAGRKPIVAEHMWCWTYSGGVWRLDCDARLAMAVPPNAFRCEMECDRDAPIRVTVVIADDGAVFDADSNALRFNACRERSYKFSPSFLKSLLQKNIRLSRPDSAVRSALLAIKKINIVEFLRRLLIIIVEDAAMHAAFPWLTCMTIACSKGYKPTTSAVSLMLSIVYELAAVAFKEDVADDIAPVTLHDNVSTMSRALLLRAFLGGMPGDVELVRRAAAMWASRPMPLDARFAFGPGDAMANDSVYEPVMVDVDAVAYPDDADLVLSAVDYHCSDMGKYLMGLGHIRALLPPRDDNSALLLLQNVIWRCRSSLTNKKEVNDRNPDGDPEVMQRLQAIYERIRDDIEAFAIDFIDRRRAAHSQPLSQ
ncbi:hypothetical protein PBRA_004593 [Plasmodiophora brassicae]|nr:hypothetical protein PBRA_004593 [Plasmodiophora brassicae]